MNPDTFYRRCDVCGDALPRWHDSHICISCFLWAHEIDVEYRLNDALIKLGNTANILHVGVLD